MKKTDFVIYHFRVKRPNKARPGDTFWDYGGDVIAPKDEPYSAVFLIHKKYPDCIGRPILRYTSPVNRFNFEMDMPGAENWKEAD